MQALGHYRSQLLCGYNLLVEEGRVGQSLHLPSKQETQEKSLEGPSQEALPMTSLSDALCLPGACLTLGQMRGPMTGLVLFSQFRWATSVGSRDQQLVFTHTYPWRSLPAPEQ